VLDTEDLLHDEGMFRSGFLAHVAHPIRGDVVLPGWPVRMSASPRPDVAPPPLLGQHNQEVLRELPGTDAVPPAN